MRKDLKKVIILSVIGLALGLLVGAFFWFFGSEDGGEAPTLAYALRHFAVSGLFGAYAMGSTVFYDVEHWSITRATLTHFVPLFLMYLAVGIIQSWFTFGDPVFWVMTIIWLAMYFIIWLICYLGYKKEIGKMNRQLESWKTGAREDTQDK